MPRYGALPADADVLLHVAQNTPPALAFERDMLLGVLFRSTTIITLLGVLFGWAVAVLYPSLIHWFRKRDGEWACGVQFDPLTL